MVVSGAGTGKPVDLDQLAAVARAAGDRPVLIGSGATPERAPALLAHASGLIVGTWLKEGGRVDAPVDAARVRTLVAAVRQSAGVRPDRLPPGIPAEQDLRGSCRHLVGDACAPLPFISRETAQRARRVWPGDRAAGSPARRRDAPRPGGPWIDPDGIDIPAGDPAFR